MENTEKPCKTCGKLDQPHDPCDCPDIQIGSVVFHRNPISPDFKGPGTVVKIVRDTYLDVDAYIVSWQGSSVLMDHYRRTLLTLAEKEAGNVG